MKKMIVLIFFLLGTWVIFPNVSQASVGLSGQFRATEACEALSSIRRQTNPGGVRLDPGQVYTVMAKNNEIATHYYIRIDGVEPSSRWVLVGCGEFSETANLQSRKQGGNDTLLAISWQPAFCETHEDKPECQTQTSGRFDASNFTLHGLWPQPRGNEYCNVSQQNIGIDRRGDWFDLPPIELSDTLLEELREKMPGVESGLHLHEWYKHGTCYSETPEEYFQESLDLLDQVNRSTVRELFVENINQSLNSSEVEDSFEESFPNAENKIAIECDRDREPTNRRMIVELKLNFKGDIDSDTELNELFGGGKMVSLGCSEGEVDRAGFN